MSTSFSPLAFSSIFLPQCPFPHKFTPPFLTIYPAFPHHPHPNTLSHLRPSGQHTTNTILMQTYSLLGQCVSLLYKFITEPRPTRILESPGYENLCRAA